MIALFASAFVLGLIFNAAPGAVFAETIRQGVRGGFKPAFAVQIGSLVGDALWAILGLVGIGLLLQLEWLRMPIGIAGAAYLVWLAWDSWRAASHEFSVEVSQSAQCQRKALRAGVLLSVTNPQNVAYWAGCGRHSRARAGRLRDFLRGLHGVVDCVVVHLCGVGGSGVPPRGCHLGAADVPALRHRVSGTRVLVVARSLVTAYASREPGFAGPARRSCALTRSAPKRISCRRDAPGSGAQRTISVAATRDAASSPAPAQAPPPPSPRRQALRG
jgi:hypothetical protein